MKCSNVATAQTQAVRGPGGVAAVLKVHSEDDHAKNSHDCRADYQLLVSPAKGGSAVVTDLLSSDAEWARELSVRLDGFSSDGKRVYGILSQFGKYPFTNVFDYNTTDRKVRLINLDKVLAQLRTARCGSRIAVIGTTEKGSIVIEPDTADAWCRSTYRRLLDSSDGDPGTLAPGHSVIGLYKADPQ